MSNKTHISIVIPCYNIRRYIDACLDSVMSQKGKIGLQVLCIDDGSSDGTSEILATYAQKYPRIISVLNQTNRNYGVSSARNFGLNNATGETVMFVDGDDIIGGTKEVHKIDQYFLENFYTTLKDNPDTAMIVGSIAKLIDDEIVRTEHDIVSDNKLRKVKSGDPSFVKSFDFLDYRISSCNTLYRSDLVNKYKPRFRSDMMYFEDAHFVMQYTFAALKEKYDYILKPTDAPALYLYRSRPDSAINKLLNHSESGMRYKESVKNCSQYYAYVLRECENMFGIESCIYHSFARAWAHKAASRLTKVSIEESLLRDDTPQYCCDCGSRHVCNISCPHLSDLQILSKKIGQFSH